MSLNAIDSQTDDPPFQMAPYSPTIGAEVSGIDLGKPMTDGQIMGIRAALLERKVLFFRDQDITPPQQLAFAKRFGDIHFHPHVPGLPDIPEIMEILKTDKDARPFGVGWHTDQMFNPQPAKATMLYAKETPSAGGDTLFANMALAFELLSDTMKDFLSD